MLISDLNLIGENLYHFRKKCGLTQSEVAELAELSDRTYADIERGNTNMRIDTLIKICSALKITPNDILVSDDVDYDFDKINDYIKNASKNEKNAICKLLSVFIDYSSR